MEDNERLVCPICNRSFKLLGRHIKLTHKISKDEINRMYPGIKLITDSERERISSELSEYRDLNWKNPEYRSKMIDAARRNMKAILDNPELVKKGQEECYKSRMNHAKEDPEWWHRVRSIAGKNSWKNQSRRNYHHELLVKLWQNPNYKNNQTNRFIKMLNDIWSDPDKVKESFHGYRTKMNYSYESKYNGIINFRSSWEKLFAEILDSNDIKWEYESVSIKYEYKNQSHRYIPDFYLSDYNTMIEIKPSSFITDKVLCKLESCSKSGYRSLLVTEKQLWLNNEELVDYLLSSSTTIESRIVEMR